jgi:hypothetical protein
MSCARGERRESDEESVYSFSSFIFLGGVFMGELTGVKRQPPQKTRRGKISSLFVRRARSLLESALIGREEHDDAVVKVVGEEEEEVEQKVRVRRRAERINNNNKSKHVVARDD